MKLCTDAGSMSVLIAKPSRMRVVDLHRPEALNALNAEMVSTLLPLVRNWQQPDGDVKLVVFRGAGDRAFCAGGDIRFLHSCAVSGELTGAHAFFREEYQLNHAIGTSRVPIVSLLDGIVMGGGVGLSVHGTMRVANESSVFAMPETGIGFFPDVGGTWFLPRLRGHLGTYLGLTGARLRGRDLLTAGIATHFVPRDRTEALEGMLLELAAATEGKAYTLESNQDFVDPELLSSAVSRLDQLDGLSSAPDQPPATPVEILTDETLSEIDEIFSAADVGTIVKAVNAAAAAAASSNHWAVSAAKDLSRASPTALAVTLAALKRGKKCTSLGECLKMEFRMSQHFLKHPDFASGVNAVLTKGKEPAKWVQSVPTAFELESWFEVRDGGELEFPE